MGSKYKKEVYFVRRNRSSVLQKRGGDQNGAGANGGGGEVPKERVKTV